MQLKTIGKHWECNWKEIGMQLESSLKAIRKQLVCNWKLIAMQLNKNSIEIGNAIGTELERNWKRWEWNWYVI